MRNYSWWQVGRLKLFSFDWSYCQQMLRICMRRPSRWHFWEECWRRGWELLCWDVLLPVLRANSDLRPASSKGTRISKSPQRLSHHRLLANYSFEILINKLWNHLVSKGTQSQGWLTNHLLLFEPWPRGCKEDILMTARLRKTVEIPQSMFYEFFLATYSPNMKCHTLQRRSTRTKKRIASN